MYRVRKERKVRPGFTPVEDVVRYRPGRAREAEEARRRAVQGSAALPAASTTATSSASRKALPTGLADTAGRPGAATLATRSSSKDTAQRPRGNFAPLEPQKTPSKKDASSDKTASGTSEASSSEAKPWRNSRLRRPLPPEQSQDSSAVPDAWDQDRAKASGKPDTQSTSAQSASRTGPSADALAEELESLRIDKGK